MKISINSITALVGEMRPPSDKSLTHRAYMFASIASGPSQVRKPLRGEDCESTLRCLSQLGLQATWRDDETVSLSPAETWQQPSEPLDCGNSGTTMRLMSGLLASRKLAVTMTGDASLSRRPMKRIAQPLRMMGAEVRGDTPPLYIEGTDIHGIDYQSPVASAQIKSCVLLAGLRAEGVTTVHEPSPSRDHTERMLRATGVQVVVNGGVSLRGGQVPVGFEFTVPADISSAAFFIVAAACLPSSELLIRDLNINPTRTGILDVLRQSGVNFSLGNEREELGEPIADVSVFGGAGYRPFEISGPLVPRLIDEIPVLAVLATQCDGTSVIRDAQELRIKESDRIEAVASALRAMGASVETTEDGMAITGPTRLRGTTVEAHADHRIAMAFAIAGLLATETTHIEGAESIATSYPEFMNDLRRLAIA